MFKATCEQFPCEQLMPGLGVRSQEQAVLIVGLDGLLNDAEQSPSNCFLCDPECFESVRGERETRLKQSTFMEILGVKFAPLRVPLQRRLQTFAVAAWFFTFAFGNFLSVIFTLLVVVYTQYVRWLVLLYLAWVWYDWDAGCRGGRRVEWVRNWAWWRYYRDYFPLRLEKTVDLPPNRNYLLCAYPHGVLSTGSFGNFATNASDFSELFPGLTAFPITLSQHFHAPFFRELALSLGACASDKESIEWLLGSPGTGRAPVLIVGGASESLNCRPGTYRIIVRRRKGFVRLALKHGVPIVPVFSFGEVDLYDQVSNPEGSFVRRSQEAIRKLIGLAPVLPIGRGFFQYSFGLVPRRRCVTTVVGRPIEVPRISAPSVELVDQIHSQFIEALSTLFEENKHKYIQNAEKTFLSIE